MLSITSHIKSNSLETLFKNEWISIKNFDGWYTYAHESKCFGRSVCILGYRSTKHKDDNAYEFLGRMEICPIHKDSVLPYSLTGGMEEDTDDLNKIKSHAVKEFLEEAGIEITTDDLEFLGFMFNSKGADTRIFCFCVDLDGKPEPPKNPAGDGSKGEKDAYCKWMSLQECSKSTDGILLSVLFKFLNKDK